MKHQQQEDFSVNDHPPCCTIVPKRLAVGSNPERLVDHVLAAIADGRSAITIDLSHAFVDSGGIGLIITCFRKAQEVKADLYFIVNPKLLATLKRMKLDNILPLGLATE